MKTENISYDLDDGQFDVFVARPDDDGPHPAVLVCHAWGGRDEFAEGKAKQLAALGYIGAAIDLYGVGVRGTDRESNQRLMMALVGEPPRLMGRLSKAEEVVRMIDGVDDKRMAAVGYCFGGLCAIMAARMGLALRGVVSFHGLLKVGRPLDEQVHAKILLEHGQDDPMVPPSDMAAFIEEMRRVDAEWTLHAYPGVVHSFTNPGANDPEFGTVYNEDADRRSWVEMKQFLQDVLT